MNNSYYILDVRGLIIRAGSAGDKTVQDGEEEIVSWQDGLYRFYERELLPLIQQGIAPRQIIACWDSGNTYRTSIFPTYKAKRLEKSKTRSQVSKQENNKLFENAKRLMAYLGIKNVSVPGEEADDLIALLCTKLDAAQIIVKTVDEDLLQLLAPNVSVQHGHKTYTYQVHRHMSTDKGTPIALMTLYKSLAGDSSDEYPGVKGFGPKAWEGLLESYGMDGLEQIEEAVKSGNWKPVQAAHEATQDKTLQLMLERWSEWRTSYQLATLHPEACYGTYSGKRKAPEWYVRIPNREKVLEIFTELHVANRVVTDLEHLFPVEGLITTESSELLQTEMEKILQSSVVAYDFESTDKNKFECYQKAKTKGTGKFIDVLSQELAGISINYGANFEKTIYIPFDHADTANYSMDWARWVLQTLDQRTGPTVVQNAMFEVTVAANNVGLWVKPPFDTAIMASYVDENEEAGLKQMSKRVLNYNQASYQEVTQGRDMCQLTGAEVLSYGCDDSLVTSHLFDLYRIIMQLEGSWDFYRKHEVEPVIDDAFHFIAGTDLDVELLKEFQVENTKMIADKETELRELLAANVDNTDLESAKRKATVLFNEWWQLDCLRVMGQPDEKVKLEQLRDKLWTRAWFSCFYTPMTSKTKYEDVTPTPGRISRIAKVFMEGAPKLEKATKGAVEEWEAETMDFIGTDKSDGAKLLEELAGLVFAARKDLGPTKRSGDAYEGLKAFCAEHLQKVGQKKVTVQGDELNFGSGPQMQGLLYGKLGLPIQVRSKIDRDSTRDRYGLPGSPATGLKAIAAAVVFDIDETDWRHPALMAYKDIAARMQNESLYYSKYPLWVSPQDGKLHPQIRNCGTVTRRPSGTSPNVLQVSGKQDENHEARIRKLFPAGDYGDGERLVVSLDWQGQELLIIACESQDPVMLDAFESDPRKDIHAVTGSGLVPILMERLGGPRLPDLPYDAFTAALHDKEHELNPFVGKIRKEYAKATNFTIAYLGGPTTLANRMLINIDLAREIMGRTLELYGRIKPWQDETVQFARVHGYTQTAYGNRRHAEDDLWGGDDSKAHRVGRQVTNATIQSTAADILKVTRQQMRDRDILGRYQVRAVKPIYDELTASVPRHLVGAYVMEMAEIMRIRPPGYSVTLDIDVEIGRTWGDQIEVAPTSAEAINEEVSKL